MNKIQGEKIPNSETLKAHQDALDDKATEYSSMDEFWKDMGINKIEKVEE